jgi:hypothetical protein
MGVGSSWDRASAASAVRTAFNDLTTLQRTAGPDANRPDTKAGSDAGLIAGTAIPAMDRLLALIAMMDALEPGPDMDSTETQIIGLGAELRTAAIALYEPEARNAVQSVADALPAIEEPA